jgi:hypothetical protein
LPFSLHPSGFCCYYSATVTKNLVRGFPCVHCGRVSGHAITCPAFKYDETKGRSSRPQLFNATAVLWAKSPKKSFLTFTLPSIAGGTYQRDFDCPETGDLIVAEKFSKVMEAFALRSRRLGEKLSYVWVAEAQMKRKEKFGGIGDIHYHCVINKELKGANNHFTDFDSFQCLQALWNSHVGVTANNSLDVKPLPEGINSIPAYMSKYLGKGSQRMIIARQFAASRDLTRFKPIALTHLPVDCELISERDYISPTGYETSLRYFNTRDVLEQYGGLMAEQSQHEVTRTGKQFTPAAIIERGINRQRRSLGLSYST